LHIDLTLFLIFSAIRTWVDGNPAIACSAQLSEISSQSFTGDDSERRTFTFQVGAFSAIYFPITTIFIQNSELKRDLGQRFPSFLDRIKKNLDK